MILWSRGLGRRELPFRLSEAEVGVDDGRLVLRGTIVAPKVRWAFCARFGDDDIVGFVRLLSDRRVVALLAGARGWRLAWHVVGAALRGVRGLGRGG